jgi:hypothetical protein
MFSKCSHGRRQGLGRFIDMALTWTFAAHFCSALGGIRTPNLLIRSSSKTLDTR